MSEYDDPPKTAERQLQAEEQIETGHENMVAIELCGKNPERWERREPRFIERLKNSFRKLLGADIRPEITANNELLDAADTLAKSAQEALKAPQLHNLERQASVKLKLAEAMEKEANARRTNLEADMLEIEVKSKHIHESQAIIDRLIQRGDLIPVEKDGELFMVYKKRKL